MAASRREQPIIGITCDTASAGEAEASASLRATWRYVAGAGYSEMVVRAGGVPVLLPHHADRVEAYLAMCDGIVLGGGDDPDTTPFGEPVHPAAKLVTPQRQAFETALLASLDSTRHPVLGVCLGMQMMALHHGGRLHQHLPDLPPEHGARAEWHRLAEHDVRRSIDGESALPEGGRVHSNHHQAVADPGAMRAVAVAPDRVIEAIDLPGAGRFYLGVQWHPERTACEPLGLELFRRLVDQCRFSPAARV